jgi:hypothetical protein
MKQFYIGTRSNWNTMNDVAGTSVSKLNTRMSETIRSAALKQGIKKTQDGKKLEFYLVSEEQLQKLTNPATATLAALKHGADWHPLIAVDKDIMVAAISQVNAKYGNRMPRDVFAKYNAELLAGVESAVVKLAEDKKVARAKYYNSEGLAEGDIIRDTSEWRQGRFALVTKVSEHSYSYKVYEPLFTAYGLSLMLSAEQLTQRGITLEGADQQDGKIQVPFKGNEDLFKLSTKTKTKRFSRYSITVQTAEQAEYNSYWYAN